MVRIGVLTYAKMPDPEWLTALLGERTAALLAVNRRGSARTETLLGFCLLSQMLPDADLSALQRTPEGRPFLSGRPDLDFSLTHCRGLVACAVGTGGVRVGIDAEPTGTQTPAAMGRIAARWFSPAERDGWERNGRDEPTFLALWTAKEAASKWQGGGLRDLRTVDLSTLSRATYRVGSVVLSAVCDPGNDLPAGAERFSLPATGEGTGRVKSEE